MADDKQIKFIMYHKRNKTSATQTLLLSRLKIHCSSDNGVDTAAIRNYLKIKHRYFRDQNIKSFNDLTPFLQRKKKHRYDKFQANVPLLNTAENPKNISRDYSLPLLNHQIYNMVNDFQVCNSAAIYAHKSFNNLQNQTCHFPFIHNTTCKVYRCQFSTQEESCCCSCNSDAMFEVMKSLYDCYKKKNCDHCNCILCGHLPREERRLGELRKAGVEVATSAKEKMKKKKISSKEVLTMLEGKTAAEKEKTLKELAKAGVPLPKPRTTSEEALMAKVKTELGLPAEPSTRKIPSEKLRKAKEMGLLTPLEGKTADQKEKIFKGMVMNGIPLPQGKTDSERKIIDKVRKDLGMPPEPKSASERKKYKNALEAGIITPLEGKNRAQKEQLLKKQAAMGIPLPQGRTASEKSLIAKIQKSIPPPSEVKVPSEKLKKAKAAGLLTPLEGKTPEQREKILRGLAMNGIPLPPPKSDSERNIIDKVRKDLGLPPEPKTSSQKNIYKKALAAGIITPLEGKTAPQKEEILKKQAAMGIPLPQGRTASEKALIAKIQQAAPPAPSEYKVPSEKMKKAKAEGLLTPLEGKTPAQKEKILKDLAMNGIPLPTAKTDSERNIIEKVRKDLGLPPEPKTASEKSNYKKALAAGIITPLEGKTTPQKEEILKKQAAMGLPLPQGRTASEKALIAKIQQAAPPPPSEYKVPSEKMKKAKAEGLLTPLEGKTPAQKEKILKGLAMNGIPLPVAKTDSERNIIDKVRKDLGLPPEPKTSSDKSAYKKALAAGIITPLEGKTAPQKEEILKKQAAMGIPLPEGRTASEKAMIAKIKQTVRPPSGKVKKSDRDIADLLTKLEGKPENEKKEMLKAFAMQGKPLPEGRTASEKKLIDKVRQDIGLPPEPKSPAEKDKYKQAVAAGIIVPLEGKSKAQKEKILQAQADMGLELPEGRTASEKSLIKKIKSGKPKRAKSLPPDEIKKLDTKTAKVMKEGKGPSDECICDILTPESEKVSRKGPQKVTSEKLRKAKAAGLLTPLKGKSTKEKERILKGLAKEGLPLPEPETASEKQLMEKIKTEIGVTSPAAAPARGIPSEKMRKAKAAGLLTPLQGKPEAEKERILRGLAQHGIPLPPAQSASEKKIIDKVRKDLGLPPEPKTPSLKEKYQQAHAAGFLTPLEGKSKSQKEKILTKQAEMGIPLPEGRTQSEKDLINKIRASIPKKVTSEKLRKAKAAGLLTPLEGKSAKEKERILKSLAKEGLPMPEPKTASEKQLIAKVKTEMGVPLEKVSSERLRKAKAAGLITPLEGKSPTQKEKILRGRIAAGLPLPEGVTPSDKELIKKVKAETGYVSPPVGKIPSEKIRKAKAAGLLTPLQGKPAAEKERILKGLAQHGIPLPPAQSASEKKIIDKVRKDLGLPPEPKTPSLKEKYQQAHAAGYMTPLEGKSNAQKEKILTKQAEMGIPLPEGRTQSEKDMINRIRQTAPKKIASEKLRKAKEAGLLTPLQGKSPKEKEKIIRGLAKAGLPLPEGKTASEKQLIKKVKADMGLPVEEIPSEKLRKALAEGLITPLEGKSAAQKEKILRGRAAAGLPLPEGVTPSDKELIKKVKAETGYVTPRPEKKKRPSEKVSKVASMPRGPGVTSTQREKFLKDLAMQGKQLPPGKTASEIKVLDKVRRDLGIPPEPKSPAERDKYKQAVAAGIIVPLEGKTKAQKEKILQAQADMGIELPEGRTASEKSLIKKIKSTKPKRAKSLPPDKIRKLDTKTAKVMKEGKGPSDECICDILTPDSEKVSRKAPQKVTSEKLRKAKAGGLLTPLKGKSTKEKERILKGLAKEGLPLPEPETASEKQLIEKIKTEMGVTSPAAAPARGIPSEKMRKAKAAGLLTPLQGKPEAEKERILRGLAQHGIPLPPAQSASEKKIIDKVRKDLGLPPEPKTPSLKEKYQQAHAAGFMTPLEGKSAAQKEKILTKQAEMGIPLPEGRTKSEKELINRIRATAKKLPSEMKADIGGKTIKASTPSEKEVLRKAKAEGLLTPLKGKTPEQKERILKGLAEAGLPMPEAKSASEKALIEKVRTAQGLPLEPTPSEKKGKIKTKSRKTGVAKARLSEVGVGAGKVKAGITEEFEDIVKTTTCDRGCGCDRKKIRFKHSYVKIRVTSPDISSLCPCPEECLPGVKGGVFTDNEGIKVTVGQVTGIPSYHSKESKSIEKTIIKEIGINLSKLSAPTVLSDSSLHMLRTGNNLLHNIAIDVGTTIKESFNSKFRKLPSKTYPKNEQTFAPITRSSISDTYILIKSSSDFSSSEFSIKLPNILEKLNPSLIFSTSSNISVLSNTISIISFSLTDCSSNSYNYSTEKSSIIGSIESIGCTTEDPEYLHSGSRIEQGVKSFENVYSSMYTSGLEEIQKTNCCQPIVFRIVHNIETLHNKKMDEYHNTRYMEKDKDLITVVGKILSDPTLKESSSLYVVLPTSSEDESSIYSMETQPSSTICIQLSESQTNWTSNLIPQMHYNPHRRYRKQRGIRIATKGKNMERRLTSMRDSFKGHFIQDNMRICPEFSGIQEVQEINKTIYEIATDTTEDRPCCCDVVHDDVILQVVDESIKKTSHVFSELVAPFIIKEAVAQGFTHDNHEIRNGKSSNRKYSSNVRICVNQTPVRHCRIPPCSGYTECHPRVLRHNDQDPPPQDYIQPRNPVGPQSKVCECDFEKLKQIIDKFGREKVSTGCGSSNDVIQRDNKKRAIKKAKTPEPTKTIKIDCGTCNKPNAVETGELLCVCRGQKKKISTGKNCPCEEFGISNDIRPETGPGFDKSMPTAADEPYCKCKKSKKNKNIICQCPQEPPEEETEPILWIDEKQIRKMRSDLTQTMSGFKVNKAPKGPAGPEMSFEEALAYYELYDNESIQGPKSDLCICDEERKKKRKKGNCECPYEDQISTGPVIEEKAPDDPFRGIKFQIQGKGSMSRGLSGVLCFELFEH